MTKEFSGRSLLDGMELLGFGQVEDTAKRRLSAKLGTKPDAPAGKTDARRSVTAKAGIKTIRRSVTAKAGVKVIGRTVTAKAGLKAKHA
jgi:hypothetical protein